MTKVHKLILAVFVVVLSAPAMPVFADHPAVGVPDNKYVNKPWRGGLYLDWEGSVYVPFDIRWFADTWTPMPASSWTTRVSEAVAHWNSWGCPVCEPHYVQIDAFPATYQMPRSNYGNPGCAASHPEANSSPSGFQKNSWIAFGYYDLTSATGQALGLAAQAHYCHVYLNGDVIERWTYVAFNERFASDWYSGTGTPASDQIDVRATATHEIGHALGWEPLDQGTGWGGGDDGGGHFTGPLACNANLPSTYQTMCSSFPIDQPNSGSIQVNQRSLGSHDLSATRSGYYADCETFMPPAPNCGDPGG